MVLNICMKFHENILKGFLSYRVDTSLSEKLLLRKFIGAQLKNTYPRVTVLALCTSCNVGSIFM